MSRSGRGRTRAEPRAASLVVLAAFGLGIGPGTAVQPCPRHAMSSADDAHVATDGHHGEAPASSHSDGPCDCLGLCHASAVQAGLADVRVPASGVVITLRAAEPVQVVARHPARHLRPFARPPPA